MMPWELLGEFYDSYSGKNRNILNHYIGGDPMSALNDITPLMNRPRRDIRYSTPFWNPVANHGMEAFRGQIDGF